MLAAPVWPTEIRRPPASVIISFCVIFVAVMFLPQTLNDSDTLWQIATGGWILDHHAIPATDPFSFTAGERRWFAHEWLAETLMALAFRGGGLVGVMVLAGFATGLTAALLMHFLRRVLPGVYATAALALALYSIAPSLLARPHLLAWPCLAAWCGGLVAARTQARAPAFALLPVMLIWVNLHGSFVLGLLLPAAFMIEAVMESAITDRPRVAFAWLKFIAAAWAIALLNPEFFDGIVFPFHLVGMASLASILEWQPPDFSRVEPIEVMICGGLALGLSGRLRLPPIRLVILLGLVHMALAHARNQPLLGIIGAFIVAGPFGEGLERDRDDLPDPAGRRPAGRQLAGVATVIAVAGLLIRFAVPLGPERSEAAFMAMLEHVPQPLRRQPVLNDYGIGGRLIFAGVRPFIDGRTDLYGDIFVHRYREIMAPDHAAFVRAVSDYGIAWTLFRADEPIIGLLDREPGWHRLLTDGGLVIHARDE